jgi:hypothetical protein
VLTAVGIATARKVQKPEQKLFASIPFLFGIQQFCEGILWITLKAGKFAELQNVTEHIFLTFALVIWPLFLPLAVRLMEHAPARKAILTRLTIMGFVTSLFYAYCLIFYKVTPEIQGFHIQYNDQFPGNIVHYAFIFYLGLTVLPSFVSTVKWMWVFGILIAVSGIVTGIFYSGYLTSVWCFFAAGLSVIIYGILNAPATEPTPAFQEILH